MALQSGYTNINSLLQANPNLYGDQYRQMQGTQSPQFQQPIMQSQGYPMPNAPQDYNQQGYAPQMYGQDNLNPQFQYQVGAPEPQQPSFQAQQGAEQPGQVWQQGLQQAIQDGSIREYLDKTVYKRETEAERKKREEEEKKKQALTPMGDKTKGYTSTPYQMQFTPVNTLLR